MSHISPIPSLSELASTPVKLFLTVAHAVQARKPLIVDFLLACKYAEFKVVGSASVHLTGYYLPEHDQGM